MSAVLDDVPFDPPTTPAGGALLQGLLQRQRQQRAELRTLAGRVAAVLPLEAGDRVVFRMSEAGEWMHGFVLEPKPNHEGQAGAWVRVMGYSAWSHWAAVTDIRRTCGVCVDCLNLNDRPACSQRGGRS